MKKLQSIILIIACFLLMTAFVTVKGKAEPNQVETDEIIAVIDNAKIEKEQIEEENENLYHGHRGNYEFKDSEVFEGENGNKILVLNVNYTNTTKGVTLPLFSFYLDTTMSQEVDGTIEPIEKANIVLENKLNKNNLKVQPGETVSILVPVELKSNNGTVFVKDLMSNGNNFTKTIEL